MSFSKEPTVLFLMFIYPLVAAEKQYACRLNDRYVHICVLRQLGRFVPKKSFKRKEHPFISIPYLVFHHLFLNEWQEAMAVQNVRFCDRF